MLTGLALPGVFVRFFAADIGFINLDNLVRAAQTAFRQFLAHPFADAVRHEPGRAVGAETEHPPQLVRRDAFLAGAEQMRRQQPFMERDMRALVSGADRRGKGFLAALALVDAGSRAFAL
jgi:hypothetical protein